MLWITLPAKHISLSSQKLYVHFDTSKTRQSPSQWAKFTAQNVPYEFTLAIEECCYFKNAKEIY